MTVYIAFNLLKDKVDLTAINESGNIIEQLVTTSSDFTGPPRVLQKLLDTSSKIFIICNNQFSDICREMLITLHIHNDNNKIVIIEPSQYYKTLFCTTDNVSNNTIMKTFHITLNEFKSQSEEMALLFYHTQQALLYRRYGYRAVDSIVNAFWTSVDFCKHYGLQLLDFGKQQLDNCRNSNTSTKSNKTD